MVFCRVAPDLPDELAAEARYLHDALFARPPDALTIERYRAAHHRLFAEQPTSPLVSRIVEQRLDAEAIEYALRARRHGRDLTRKLQILCYLAEARAAYQDEFINRIDRRRGAILRLAGAALRSLWMRLKGELLVRRHGLL